ncbi:MAG: 30S ribosomal protein S14 [Rickettsiales bacterium]|jgi:small subunit ribosomal protein S14|nr:30S ribosomal protein S14 [Rickettsiales bacterium]
MAKLALINKQNARKKMAKKYAAKFEAVKILKSDTPEVRMEKMKKAADLPRNANKTRLHNRCAITGRARGFVSQFGLCRQQVRTLASEGKLPGVRKSSW